MLPSQIETKSSSGNIYSFLLDPNQQEQFEWKGWKLTHPELKRTGYSTVVMDDKIVVLGGSKPLVNEEDYTVKQALNIAIVDPKAQTVKVLPPIGDDAKKLCWCTASACYWKDSKIVVYGGGERIPGFTNIKSSIGIITLKDLDSEGIHNNYSNYIQNLRSFRTLATSPSSNLCAGFLLSFCTYLSR